MSGFGATAVSWRWRANGFGCRAMSSSARSASIRSGAAWFGSGLTRYLAHRARAHCEIPFLHVFPENAAMMVYARLGFRERAWLWVLGRRPRGGDYRDGVAVVRPAPSRRVEP